MPSLIFNNLESPVRRAGPSRRALAPLVLESFLPSENGQRDIPFSTGSIKTEDCTPTPTHDAIKDEHSSSRDSTPSFTMPSSSPYCIPTGNGGRGTTYCSTDDTVSKVKAQSNRLEDKIHDLEEMVRGFRTKVKGVAWDFNTLRADVERLSSEFDALEDDHRGSLASVQEEKATATYYLGLLRNTEKELYLVYQNIENHPDHLDLIPGSFSQVTSLDPIIDEAD